MRNNDLKLHNEAWVHQSMTQINDTVERVVCGCIVGIFLVTTDRECIDK